MVTPVVLGVLAVLLAGPLPWLLSRWARLRRTPAAAMLLWQSTALAAVLAALGAGVALVTDRLWEPPVAATDVVVASLAGGVPLVVLVRLLLSGHRTGTDLRRMRRLHRERVDLVARVDGGVSVLEHDLPVAYCVPGMSGSRIVVSRSTLTRLEPAELSAVLEHERSHLRARRALLSALLALAGSPSPAGSLGSGSSLAARVEVLRDTRPHRVQSVVVAALAAAILALPTLLVVLPWLTGLDAR